MEGPRQLLQGLASRRGFTAAGCVDCLDLYQRFWPVDNFSFSFLFSPSFSYGINGKLIQAGEEHRSRDQGAALFQISTGKMLDWEWLCSSIPVNFFSLTIGVVGLHFLVGHVWYARNLFSVLSEWIYSKKIKIKITSAALHIAGKKKKENWCFLCSNFYPTFFLMVSFLLIWVRGISSNTVY
jgi:hypothetical protein